MPPSSAYDNAERNNPRKRGWRAQGLLAGEWRDRFGRHRRAYHYSDRQQQQQQQHAAVSSSVAADLSMGSIPCTSSCAGTEVSFEGLIEELRKRLPHSSSSLLEMVAVQQSICIAESAFDGENTVVTAMGAGNPEEQEIVKRGEDDDADVDDIEQPGGWRRSYDASSGNNKNNSNRNNNDKENNWKFGGERIAAESFSPPRRGTTRGYATTTSNHQQQQRGLPRGCVQLRPMVEPFRASPSRQALSTGGFGERLRHAVGSSNPCSLLLASFSHGGGSSSSKYDITAAATETREEENVSPSAAMVAAAKAQERALPLLQVCAVKLVEPAGRG